MARNDTNTIFFQSLGCAKNLVDSEVMLGLSQSQGYSIVSAPDNASIIVVNTCSFIDSAKKESIDTILGLLEFKKTGSCRKLIVAGCLPQRYLADLKVSFPEVDAFVGTGQYHRIVEFINNTHAGKQVDEEGFSHPRYIHHENTPRMNSQPFFRAYLKISEGCIRNCSFCIIPKIRGTLRSRRIHSLLDEAKRLVSGGVRELNLIAQDLTDYGRDLGDGSNLAKLLQALVTIEGLWWIRLLYVYPDGITDDLLHVIRNETKICKYIDMPIQHISDRILRQMNRNVTGGQIRDRLTSMRQMVPGICVRSTLIVGFPGETENQFQELSRFVENEASFDHLGVFTYSREDNTPAYTLMDQVPENVKLERRDTLMKLQQVVSRKILRNKVGEQLTVLLEKELDKGVFQGRHQGQAPDVDGVVLVHKSQARQASSRHQPHGIRRQHACHAAIGRKIDVKILKSLDYDLVGTIAS